VTLPLPPPFQLSVAIQEMPYRGQSHRYEVQNPVKKSYTDHVSPVTSLLPHSCRLPEAIEDILYSGAVTQTLF
jgi:hypothetical protein